MNMHANIYVALKHTNWKKNTQPVLYSFKISGKIVYACVSVTTMRMDRLKEYSVKNIISRVEKLLNILCLKLITRRGFSLNPNIAG